MDMVALEHLSMGYNMARLLIKDSEQRALPLE